ncbi:MAG: DUF4093 domain-containing protein [Intestinimonas sp.]
MLHIREAIVVEGRYDKNTLSQVVDTVILETAGFGVFHNTELIALLRRLAEKRGLIILTDSDGAGFCHPEPPQRRSPSGGVKLRPYPRHRRQGAPQACSGEGGKLGVEGMSPSVLEAALRRAGATFLDGAADPPADRTPITKADLFCLGLSGGKDSQLRRREMLRRLDLPEHMGANALLSVLNALYSREEFLRRRTHGGDHAPEGFSGVGDARAKGLERLGLRTAGDLTAYFPRGYEDRREQYTIAAAPLDVPVCIPVLLAEEPRRMNIRRGLDVTRMKVVDGASAMLVTFFNQGYVRQALHRGEEYILYGKVEQMGNHRQMTNPQFEPAARPRFTGCIMPVYPLTAGVSNNLLAGLVQRALEELPPAAESLPEDFRAAHGLAPAAECYRNIHFPDSFENLEAARRRFSFEELFYLSLGLALLRERRSRGEGPVFQAAELEAFERLLPFALTGAQRRAVREAAADMTSGRPMNRLVQGDVGSGKTAVAAACAWLAFRAGWQCAMMAPTEILAEQHARSLSVLLAPAGMTVGLLTGSMRAAEKRAVYAALGSGRSPLWWGPMPSSRRA